MRLSIDAIEIVKILDKNQFPWFPCVWVLFSSEYEQFDLEFRAVNSLIIHLEEKIFQWKFYITYYFIIYLLLLLHDLLVILFLELVTPAYCVLLS